MKFKLFQLIIWLFVSTTTTASYITDTVEFQAKPATIYGIVNAVNRTDNIELEVQFWEYFVNEYTVLVPPYTERVSVRDMSIYEGNPFEKLFEFTLPAFSKIGYLTIKVRHAGTPLVYDLMKLYRIEPGDSLMIRVDQRMAQIQFNGPSADRFRCQYEMDVSKNSIQLGKKHRLITSKETLEENFKTPEIQRIYEAANASFGPGVEFFNPALESDSAIREVLSKELKADPRVQVLERYRNKIGEKFYHQLFADIKGSIHLWDLRYFHSSIRYKGITNDQHKLAYYTRIFDSIFEMVYPEPGHLSASLNSSNYISFLVEKAVVKSKLKAGSVFDQLLRESSAKIKEQTAANYLIDQWVRTKLPDSDSLIRQAKQFTTSSNIISAYDKILKGLIPGADAFNFNMQDQHNQWYRLSDFKGKTVFIDFWFTGCKPCAIYYKNTISKVEQYFKDDEDIVFLTVSRDTDLSLWKKSLESGNYTSEHATHLHTNGEGSKHPLLEFYDIDSFPFQLLIDKNGKIAKYGGMQIPANELIELINSVL